MDVLPEAVAADARDLCASTAVCLFQADLGKVPGELFWGGWGWSPRVSSCPRTWSAQTCLLGGVCYSWFCFDTSGLRWHKMSALTNTPAVLCDLWAAEETGFMTSQDCMRHPLKTLTSEIAKPPVFPTASHCLARHRLRCEQQVRAGLAWLLCPGIGHSAPNV